MKIIVTGIAGMTGVLLLAGCGVQLDQMQEGEREQEWRQVISESYPGWRPPRKAASAQYDNLAVLVLLVEFSYAIRNPIND